MMLAQPCTGCPATPRAVSRQRGAVVRAVAADVERKSAVGASRKKRLGDSDLLVSGELWRRTADLARLASARDLRAD